MGELWDGITPIRQLGIHTSRVFPEDGARQLDLFTPAERYEKLAKADQAVDSIRKRYGKNSIMRGVFLNSKIECMSGGITTEKHRPKREEVLY